MADVEAPRAVVLHIPNTPARWTAAAFLCAPGLVTLAAFLFLVGVVVRDREADLVFALVLTLPRLLVVLISAWLAAPFVNQTQTVSVNGERLLIETRGLFGWAQRSTRPMSRVGASRFEVRTFRRDSKVSVYRPLVSGRVVMVDPTGYAFLQLGPALSLEDGQYAVESLNRLLPGARPTSNKHFEPTP